MAWAVAVLTGCGEHRHDPVAAGGGHHHGSIHGGVAVELGEHQYQLDLVNDPATGRMKGWVMDGHMENFVRLPVKSFEISVVAAGSTQQVTLTAQANAGTGETVGDTSQFQGESAGLRGLTNFTGTLHELEIRGASFRQVRFEYPGHR